MPLLTSNKKKKSVSVALFFSQGLLGTMCVVLMMTVLSFQLLVTKEVTPPATRIMHLFGRPRTLRLPHFLHVKKKHVVNKLREKSSVLPLPFLDASQKCFLAFSKSLKLANKLASLAHPFIQQTVKLIAHPPQLTPVLLGCPQGRGRRLGPSPKRSSVSGGSSFIFPLSLELLISGDGGCVGLRVDPGSTGYCQGRKVRGENNNESQNKISVCIS